MKAAPYSESEQQLVAAEYVLLAVAQYLGEKRKKVTVVAELVAATGRSRGSIESKFMNYSAVAVEFDLLPALPNGYVKGYKPASKYQKSMKDALIVELYRELHCSQHPASGIVRPVTVVNDPVACFGAK